MRHNILFTVDGYSFLALAFVEHVPNEGRIVTTIAAAHVPQHVMGALTETALTIHDVFEVARYHLNDTAVAVHEQKCGAVEFAWYPLDRDALRMDLTGTPYAVELTDATGQYHCFELGAHSQWDAVDKCKEWVPGPCWSAVAYDQTLQSKGA